MGNSIGLYKNPTLNLAPKKPPTNKTVDVYEDGVSGINGNRNGPF